MLASIYFYNFTSNLVINFQKMCRVYVAQCWWHHGGGIGESCQPPTLHPTLGSLFQAHVCRPFRNDRQTDNSHAKILQTQRFLGKFAMCDVYFHCCRQTTSPSFHSSCLCEDSGPRVPVMKIACHPHDRSEADGGLKIG